MPDSRNFGPVTPDNELIYGACRPCYSWYRAEEVTVDDWLSFMQDQQIERVCCLLSETELDEYDDLLGTYRETFGTRNVCHAPIDDYSIVDPDTLHDTIFPFLWAGIAHQEKTVVHCSAGQGRTGHVLALWLAHSKGYSVEEAVELIEATGRTPLEAAGVTISELEQVLERE